jgi:hypothetical protein
MRCSFAKPFLCADLTCANDEDSCRLNKASYMIKEISRPLILDDKDSTRHNVDTHSESDENEKAISLRFALNRFYYSPYSAQFHALAEDGIFQTRTTLKLEPVPFSKVRSSTLEYFDVDLDREKIASFAFLKSLSDLEPYEFIRSSIFKFYLDTYEYNHFLMGSYSINIHFNKIWNLPNLSASPSENKKTKEDNDLNIDISEPKNYYCLGMFNEESNSWRCISREILGITENTIEFRSVITGTFAVLFFPKQGINSLALCGFFCKYKKEMFTFIFIVVPILAILIAFIVKILQEVIEIARKKLKVVTSNDNEALFADVKAVDSANEEKGHLKPNNSSTLQAMEDDFDINSNMETFNNPLIFNENDNMADYGKDDLEKEKVRLKYKNDQLLNEKLKLLKKVSALASEVDSFKENIDKLKRMQELNGIEQLENEAANKLPTRKSK